MAKEKRTSKKLRERGPQLTSFASYADFQILRYSHIISEFLYVPLYDEDHTSGRSRRARARRRTTVQSVLRAGFFLGSLFLQPRYSCCQLFNLSVAHSQSGVSLNAQGHFLQKELKTCLDTGLLGQR
jgi:hypothetical protein